MKRRVGVEYIPVYVHFADGRTVCICRRGSRRCKKHCTPDIVERDRYRDFERLFAVDRYGKSK